jgi:hypothetical protein
MNTKAKCSHIKKSPVKGLCYLGLYINFGQFPCSLIRIRISIPNMDPDQPNHCGYGSRRAESMRIRIQKSPINADSDPGEPNQCGSGSRRVKSMWIRIQESQINVDPDPGEPKQCRSGSETLGCFSRDQCFLVITTLDPDRYFQPKMLDPDPDSMNPDPTHW